MCWRVDGRVREWCMCRYVGVFSFEVNYYFSKVSIKG